jgi:hypothetical protein
MPTLSVGMATTSCAKTPACVSCRKRTAEGRGGRGPGGISCQETMLRCNATCTRAPDGGFTTCSAPSGGPSQSHALWAWLITRQTAPLLVAQRDAPLTRCGLQQAPHVLGGETRTIASTWRSTPSALHRWCPAAPIIASSGSRGWRAFATVARLGTRAAAPGIPQPGSGSLPHPRRFAV